MQNDVSVIIVSWNSERYILDCVRSIYANNFKDFEIIVVDNESSDSTCDLIKKNFSNIKLIKSKNRGFGAGCNLGAKYSKGKYLFFLNPDTEIKENCLENLYEFFEENNDCDVCGCKLLWEDGSFQDSYKRFFGIFTSIFELFEIHYYFKNNFLNRRVNYNFEVFQKPVEVDWVIGAAFVVKKEVFEKINGFDERFFMYFEEIDLCKRIRNLGGKIFFNPYAQVIHKKGKSSQLSNVRSIDYYKSMYLYHVKHNGKIAGFIIRLSIFFMCLIYIFVLLFKFVFLKNKYIIREKLKNRFSLLKWACYL